MKHALSRYRTTSKWTKFQKKNRNLSVQIDELSTPVVKVIKDVNATLTQNQCLQCVTPP